MFWNGGWKAIKSEKIFVLPKRKCLQCKRAYREIEIVFTTILKELIVIYLLRPDKLLRSWNANYSLDSTRYGALSNRNENLAMTLNLLGNSNCVSDSHNRSIYDIQLQAAAKIFAFVSLKNQFQLTKSAFNVPLNQFILHKIIYFHPAQYLKLVARSS